MQFPEIAKQGGMDSVSNLFWSLGWLVWKTHLERVNRESEGFIRLHPLP